MVYDLIRRYRRLEFLACLLCGMAWGEAAQSIMRSLGILY